MSYLYPCLRCNEDMEEYTSIYPLDGMICVKCADEVESGGPIVKEQTDQERA